MKRVALLAVGMIGAVFLSMPTSARAADPAGFEYNFLFGMATGPFDTDSDLYIGANIDVPIFKRDPLFGQQLNGDLMVGWTRTSDSGSFVSPSATALDLEVAPPANTEFNLTTVQVIPGVKYKLNTWEMIQPYVVLGIAFNVTTSNTDGPGGERTGGIVGVSPELRERNVPVGQGDVLIGGNFGGGVDVFVLPNVFVGADFRYNMIDRDNGSFQTICGKLGFRF